MVVSSSSFSPHRRCVRLPTPVVSVTAQPVGCHARKNWSPGPAAVDARKPMAGQRLQPSCRLPADCMQPIRQKASCAADSMAPTTGNPCLKKRRVEHGTCARQPRVRSFDIRILAAPTRGAAVLGAKRPPTVVAAARGGARERRDRRVPSGLAIIPL